jgi:hypothetical protein
MSSSRYYSRRGNASVLVDVEERTGIGEVFTMWPERD